MSDAQWETVKVGNGEMPVYRSLDGSGERRPAVIVLQEIFGVNHHIRDVADRIAREGYDVYAPDLFYRQGARFEIGYSDMAAGVERAQQMTESQFLEDISGLIARIREKGTLSNGRSGEPIPVGVVGFCMGGRLAYLTACTQDIDAAASFYGGRIASGPLSRTSGISCPIMLFYGGKDTHIPQSEIDQVRAALEQHEKEAAIYVYPDADHGFFCNERKSYQPAAAEDAWNHLKALFEEYL